MSLKPAVSPEAHLQRPSISRADSPLLGFTLQENVSPDPLHRPSPNYVRRLPDALLDNKDKPSSAPFPPAPVVLKDTEQVTRNRPLQNQNRYFALFRSRPALPRQPSLPVIRTSVPLELPSRQTFVLPRARSHHVVLRRPAVALASQPTAKSPPPTHKKGTPTPTASVTSEDASRDQKLNEQNTRVLPRARSHHVVLRRPAVALASQPAAKSTLSPTRKKSTLTLAVPVTSEDTNQALKRQKLNEQSVRVLPRARSSHVVLRRPAVAPASQPAAKSALSPTLEKNTPAPAAPVTSEEARQDLERQKLNALVIASGLADEDELRANGPSNNSIPSRAYPKEPNWVVPVEVESSRDGDTESYTSSVTAQGQFPTDSRSPARASFSLHDLDEFDDGASYYGKEMHLLFSPYSPGGSKTISPVSRYSLSSSVGDLRSKRSSTSESLESSKDEKIKFSFRTSARTTHRPTAINMFFLR